MFRVHHPGNKPCSSTLTESEILTSDHQQRPSAKLTQALFPLLREKTGARNKKLLAPCYACRDLEQQLVPRKTDVNQCVQPEPELDEELLTFSRKPWFSSVSVAMASHPTPPNSPKPSLTSCALKRTTNVQTTVVETMRASRRAVLPAFVVSRFLIVVSPREQCLFEK